MTPVSKPIQGTIRPPGSKSITNRAMILATLARGTTRLTGVLDSVDTRVMADGLAALGVGIETDFEQQTIVIPGTEGRLPNHTADLWCENSGTSIRFLTALCASAHGDYRLDGNPRMRERPIAPLVNTLRSVGLDIVCEFDNGCPPVIVNAQGLPGGKMHVAGNLSSQYLSALLMVSPVAWSDATIEVLGELVSRPYVDITLRMMEDFGAHISEPHPNVFHVRSHPYTGRQYDIEPDASAASYFFAAAAVTGGEVTVTGLHREALQGDVRFVLALERMGCSVDWRSDSITVRGGALQGIDVDMNDISDTAQTLACVAPFASGPTRIRNVAHMRLKETDRVAAVVTELNRCGIRTEEHDDGMTIHPGNPQPALVHTYDDHRMAMSFALLGLRAPGISIADPGCTSKTYPQFFADLDQLCRGET
ncbi:3-phosphoshikimate 1-carboxyvinyltransferase [Planctomicrobium sp. SH664]|uniref:3-phosphoshikimate 1-carboxyvinyltransferase n=1 Tax=Planctomicrobium sp. SH664 TaxID=3448125 RepID=UPI003F5C52FF